MIINFRFKVFLFNGKIVNVRKTAEKTPNIPRKKNLTPVFKDPNPWIHNTASENVRTFFTCKKAINVSDMFCEFLDPSPQAGNNY